MTRDFKATIALTRYREPDSLVRDVISRAASQVGVSGEILFLEQKSGSPPLETEWSPGDWIIRCVPCPEKGLSFARTLALNMACHDIVLFLDADALAEPDWALELCRALSQPSVAVAGGRIEPKWFSGREPLYARSRVVRDQWSLLDLGRETIDVARVVGASMGVRKSACPEQMHFDVELDRREGRLLSGGDTDLCHRVRRAGGRVVYAGKASVQHVIHEERERLPWIWKRLFYAGHGRATLGGPPRPSQSPGAADWLLMPLILPPYGAGWIWGKAIASARHVGSPTEGQDPKFL